MIILNEQKLKRAINESLDKYKHKLAQLRLIQQSNPMLDDYHTGVREINDILTFEEAANNEGSVITDESWTEDDIKRALSNKWIIVYSSKPIINGVFVSPSIMCAKEYAGGGKVYSKKIRKEDVAWIDTYEGQYASV
jgi:hypothetical protein